MNDMTQGLIVELRIPAYADRMSLVRVTLRSAAEHCGFDASATRDLILAREPLRIRGAEIMPWLDNTPSRGGPMPPVGEAIRLSPSVELAVQSLGQHLGELTGVMIIVGDQKAHNDEEELEP